MTAPTLQGAAASASDVTRARIDELVEAANAFAREDVSPPEHDTWQAARERLDKAYAAALASPPPAVPEGVRRLSEAATKGPFSVSGVRRRYNEASCVIVDAPTCPGLFAFATADGEEALASLADAQFAVAAMNYVRTLRSPTPSPDGPEVSAPPGGGGAVDEAFRAKIVAEAAELGLAPNPRALAAAYAIWSYAKPDGKVVYHGPTEGECYGYAWRALEAAGLAAAPATPEPAAGGEREIVRRLVEAAQVFALCVCDDRGNLSIDPRSFKPSDWLALADAEIAARPLAYLKGETLSAPAGAQTAGGEELARLRRLAQSRYELLRECQVEFRALGCTGLVETIETALTRAPAPPSSTATAHDAPDGGRDGQ